MAQLIKLRDYISRYETNPFHYPTQFIRLKQENWDRLVEFWEMENEESFNWDQTPDLKTSQENEENEEPRRFRWNPFAKKATKQEREESSFYKRHLPDDQNQLKKYFLNKLYPFQLKWATSTISHVSFTNQNYHFDQQLKYFLHHFPDIYLLMYYPIFNIKKAPIDGEIILISPIGIEIITIVDEQPDATIVVNDERTWTIETEFDSRKILSPMISIKRTESIIKSILRTHDIDFTIYKTVLSKSANFLYVTEPYQTKLIGQKEYEKWYNERRSLKSPLKAVQLKVMEALLEHCLSTAVRRPEWENDDDLVVTPFI